MIGRLIRWLYTRLRRRGNAARDVTGVLKGRLGCEVCGVRAAEHEVPSGIEDRVVLMCDWCFRRWRRLNEKRTIPRKPKKRRT